MDDISIYKNKDGRTRVYVKDEKKVISYPRYLMEKEIGRALSEAEEVHHKDGNPLNNEISNLEIKLHGEHQKEHSTKYFDRKEVCKWCGKEFTWTGYQQRIHYSNFSRKNKRGRQPNGPFCSKKCAGSYGAMVQNRSK